MLYIYQLGNGKMLCMNDNNQMEVIETGYPYPDCAIKMGDVIVKDQNQILRAILGYSIVDFEDFASKVLTLEPMSFMKWKLKIQSENIGGGCPLNSQRFAQYTLEGCKESQAFYKLLIPNGCFKDDFELPTDEWLDEHKNFFSYGFNTYLDEEKIVYSNLSDVSIDFLDILSDALINCCSCRLPEYVTVVEGYKTGIILFSDDISDNQDLKYIYCESMNIDMEDFDLTVNTFGTTVAVEYKPITKKGHILDRDEMLSNFFGSYQRYTFKDGVLDYYKEV